MSGRPGTGGRSSRTFRRITVLWLHKQRPTAAKEQRVMAA
jgi:hypothetical protein